MWLEQRCNLRCNHCGIWRNRSLTGGLSLHDRKVIIERLHLWASGPLTINFLGGELLLLPDIDAIIGHCSQLGIRTSLTTNGTLIDVRAAERLAAAGLTFISVSIDSVAPEIHDRTRGVRGAHERALDGLALLNALGAGRPTIYVNSLIMRQNLNELVQLARWTDELKLAGITFQPIAPPHLFAKHAARDLISRFCNVARLDGLLEMVRQRDRRWYGHNELWPDPAAAAAVIAALIELKQSGLPIRNTRTDLERFALYFRDPSRFFSTCECTACEALTIADDGAMKHCLAEDSLGDARRDDIAAALSSDAAQHARERILRCQRACKILSINKDDFYF
jgi:MoaA/NifB/PqqE/SkfB family radical SAM enzyme